MSGRSNTAMDALAGLSVLPVDLQRACAIVRDEVGAHRSVIASGWDPFARGCGQRSETSSAAAAVAAGQRLVFVASDLGWVLAEVAACSADIDGDIDGGVVEFGLIMPSGLLGHGSSPEDPTLQLWQNGYTPVTVHRVPVDTGSGIVEVVAATVRPTPPRP